jgi:hypothetical protein
MRLLRKRLLVALAAVLGLNAIGYLVSAAALAAAAQPGRPAAHRARRGERERQKQRSLKARFDLVTANTRDTTEFYQRSIASRGSALAAAARSGVAGAGAACAWGGSRSTTSPYGRRWNASR